jgi:serine-type D-Ala-D-Ala carboxypeptidase
MTLRRPAATSWRLLATMGALLVTASCTSRAPAPEPAVPQPAAAPAPETVAPAPPISAPAAVPRDVERRVVHAAMQRVLDRALADSAFPGAIAIVTRADRVITWHAVGRLDWAPSAAPDEHSVWDLASLTKVVGLTTAVMQLVEQGRIELDAPVQRYVPAWRGPNKERVTVRHLLTHTSGLPSFRPYDRQTQNADSLAMLLFGTALDTLPGVRMVYSDIGAFMIGQVVERVAGERLDAYLQRHVFGPLRMEDTRFNPPASWLARIAPTEIDSLRGGLVHGKVHDERAYYLGGVAAHAGLFGSAHDLARFARMMLSGGALDGVRVLRPETIARFTTLQDSAMSNRALGWEKPTGRNSAGTMLSPRAFGHTGFTGTSMWMDPAQDLAIILLSNRVNPTRNNPRIPRVRTALADSVVSALRAAATSSATDK